MSEKPSEVPRLGFNQKNSGGRQEWPESALGGKVQGRQCPREVPHLLPRSGDAAWLRHQNPAASVSAAGARDATSPRSFQLLLLPAGDEPTG